MSGNGTALLVSVQGVGAKASMAILGTLGAEGVARAVALGDWGSVRAAQGVGPETGAARGQRA
jgi:Holliday junction DNA helicase RuvA